jgi:hypothetical protein
MALTDALADAAPAAGSAAHLRRCWFRRLTRVEAGGLAVYEVQCLLLDRQGVPLGDLDAARDVCNTCQAAGVFRPDEE